MKTKPRVREMRSEYVIDYSKAVRGKYYGRLSKEGSNVVVLESDVAKAFPTPAAVNEALRLYAAGHCQGQGTPFAWHSFDQVTLGASCKAG